MKIVVPQRLAIHLHPNYESEVGKVILLQHLTLSAADEQEDALRTYVVEFVQALENEGVSVVLVEELVPGASAWSSFVVDVVFELSFHADSETLELRRKLTLSKCRHSLSIPGPHDYGLDSGVPGIWPDLLRVITGGHGAMVPELRVVTNPVCLSIPVGGEGRWAWLAPGIILSPYDKTRGHALNTLKRTPGVKLLIVNCGAMNVIGWPREGASVYDHEGPHAIAWLILSIVAKTGANVCLFNDLEGLLSRSGWTTLVLRMLEGLRLAGLTVCVHSPSEALKPVLAIADFVWDQSKTRSFLLPVRRHRSFARQLCARAPWMAGNSSIAEQSSRVENARDLETLRATRAALDGAAPTFARDSLRLMASKEWSGAKVNVEHHANVSRDDIAWLALHTGADWRAAVAALEAVESETPAPLMILLWKAICAAVAKNPAAIAELKEVLATPDEPMVLEPLLRGLAGVQQIDEADRIIADFSARYSLAPWMIERLRADARLDAEDPAVLRDAVRRLTTLTEGEPLPLIHSAETWHNLGMAHDRLGEHNDAVAALERALTLNPLLDAARDELKRLEESRRCAPPSEGLLHPSATPTAERG